MKIAVGVQDIPYLEEINQQLALSNNGYPYVMTRFFPKQADTILNSGGSLYLIINNVLCCRQIIKEFVPSTRDNGNPCTMIVLEPKIIRTFPISMRPFQGWRYLKPEDTPKDLALNHTEFSAPLPTKMRQELEKLGLIY